MFSEMEKLRNVEHKGAIDSTSEKLPAYIAK